MANTPRICIALFGLVSFLAAQNPDPMAKSGDHLTIVTQFMEHLTVIVQSDGTIAVPLMGKVKVDGLTLPRISALLEQGYAEYIDTPQVTVELVLNPVIKSGEDLTVITKFMGRPKVTVQADGMIAVPLVGRVRVEGLTLPRISAMLEQAYATYIVDPKVAVELVQKPR